MPRVAGPEAAAVLNGRAGELVQVDGRARLKTRPCLSGHAVYGPYTSLEPGKHRVEFFISPLSDPDEGRDPLIAVVDVTAGVVVTIFDAVVFRSHLEDDERYVVHFETDRPLSGVEYRIYVNGAEPLLIGDASEAVEVKRMEPPPQWAEAPALFAQYSERIRALFFAGAAIAVRGGDLVVTLAGRSVLAKTSQDLATFERLAAADRSAEREAPGEGHTAALVIALGPHSPFGEAGYELVGHVMNAIYGGHRRAHVADLAELRVLWDEHKGRPLLLTCDCPDVLLADLLATSRFPILAFFDDPANAAVYRAAVENEPLLDAIRFCARSISCLRGFSGSAQTRVFGPRHYASTLTELIEAILEAVGAEPDAGLAARVAERVSSTWGLSAGASVEALVRSRAGGETMASLAQRRFDPAERALIAEFAAGYAPFLSGREQEPLEWPLKLFYAGVNGESGDRLVDLIGGARFILFGPYLHLPVGRWRAFVQFEVADNVSGNVIEAEVWAVSLQTTLASCLANLPVQGHFQFTLDFAVADPKVVLEIRVRLTKGAIEGRFAVRRVTLHPVADAEEYAGEAGAHRLQALQASAP